MGRRYHMKKITRVPSDLQILQSVVNWVTYFRLHKLSTYELKGLVVSSRTYTAIARYNMAVTELTLSIREDYKDTRAHILSKRKKDVDA